MEPIEEGPKSTDRREFLRKAAVYAPAAVIASQLLFVGAAHGASTKGAATSSAAASSESSQGNGNAPSNTALGTLEDDLDQLQSYGSTGSKSGDNKLAAAVKDLQDAIQAPRWADDNDVVPGSVGHAVFDDVLDVYDKLAAIPGGVPAGLSNVPTDFISALSTVASNAASAGLSTASNFASDGDYDDAIVALRHIWHGSTRAPINSNG